MRNPILLLSCLIFFGCSVEKKETVNLLECVPQNTLAVFQVNDQNMLRSALSNLPFIEPIFELNDDFYKEIKAVLPESFAQMPCSALPQREKQPWQPLLFTKHPQLIV